MTNIHVTSHGAWHPRVLCHPSLLGACQVPRNARWLPPQCYRKFERGFGREGCLWKSDWRHPNAAVLINPIPTWYAHFPCCRQAVTAGHITALRGCTQADMLTNRAGVLPAGVVLATPSSTPPRLLFAITHCRCKRRLPLRRLLHLRLSPPKMAPSPRPPVRPLCPLII